jgi:hypothetical protein
VTAASMVGDFGYQVMVLDRPAVGTCPIETSPPFIDGGDLRPKHPPNKPNPSCHPMGLIGLVLEGKNRSAKLEDKEL